MKKAPDFYLRRIEEFGGTAEKIHKVPLKNGPKFRIFMTSHLRECKKIAPAQITATGVNSQKGVLTQDLYANRNLWLLLFDLFISKDEFPFIQCLR